MREEHLKKEQEKPRCHQDDSKRLARLQILDATRVDMITETLLSSDFSWQSHVCRTYNALLNVSVRFCRTASRLAWTLPSIHLGYRGEVGNVSVKTLLREFGSASDAILEVRRILASHDWKRAPLKLRFRGLGWFTLEQILWNKT